MNIQITHQVTEFDKEELLAGLRSYNAQFVDFSKNGQLGVYGSTAETKAAKW